MYASIYSYDIENGRRKHLGNVIDIEHQTVLRTFDFNTADIKGKCTFILDKPLIYTVNDERGRQLFAGFYKRSNKEEMSDLLSFAGEDFKKVLDTDVLLDFSADEVVDLTLKGIFTKVAGQITSSKDPFVSAVDLEFIIPNDTSNTRSIADYTGQYIVVNALQFLKVYLAFYNYYIKPSYDALLDRITFEFKKMSSETVSIKLKDFTHEKTSADIKVNKTIATLSFKTIMEDISWINSDEAYFNSQPSANRSTMVGLELPTPDGYAPGFAVRLVSGFVWQAATESDYYNAEGPQSTIYIQQFSGTICMMEPTIEQVIAAAGDPNTAQLGTVIKAMLKIKITGEICQLFPTYIKLIPSIVTYHQRSGMNYISRPNLPEKVYTLGKDNMIYEGYAPSEKRIYPIVAKVFESEYLSEAQLNAVYEIVNNRYVENIIITQDNIVAPLDLASLDLYTPIRVYDSDGSYKDIPISEKTYVHRKDRKSVDIKLGFKKTLLTEIIKNDIGLPSIVKSSGGGSGSGAINEVNRNVEQLRQEIQTAPSNDVKVFSSYEEANASSIPDESYAFIVSETFEE